jgi:ERCC4-type nuclease
MKQIYMTIAIYILTSALWLVLCLHIWKPKEQPVIIDKSKEIQRIDSTLNANAGELKQYRQQQLEIVNQLYEIENKKAQRVNQYYLDFNRINSITNVDQHAIDSVWYYLEQLDKQRYFNPTTIPVD